MTKYTQRIVKTVEKGAFKVVLIAYMVGDKITKVVLYVWKGTKLIMKKTYHTLEKGLVGFDNAIERFIKITSGRTVDIPIVKG